MLSSARATSIEIGTRNGPAGPVASAGPAVPASTNQAVSARQISDASHRRNLAAMGCAAACGRTVPA